jgi:hypothetical protein
MAALFLFAALPAFAAGEGTVELVIQDHKFQPAVLEIPAGKRMQIHVRNLDPTAEEFESAPLKIEKVIAGKGEGTVRLRPLEKGSYPFIGEYHSSTAKGTIIAK